MAAARRRARRLDAVRALQPLLHAPDRRARRAPARQPVLARPRCACSTSWRTATRRPRPTLGQRPRRSTPGYLSRILRRFEARGLLARTPSPADGRHEPAAADRRGRTAFAPLEAPRTRRGRRRCSAGCRRPGQRQVVEAMATIERLLGAGRRRGAGLVPAAHASAGRHGLGRPPPRRHLRAANGATTQSSRRWSRASAPTSSTTSTRRASAAGSPSGTATIVGSVFLVQQVEDGGQAAAAAGRAAGARPRHRPPAGRRVHPLRAAGGLSHAHALDAERAGRGAPALPAGGLPPRPRRAAPQLRQGSVAETWA